MPALAGEANPRGPENRPVTDRTLRFLGKTHEASVRVAYPAPDVIFDRTLNDEYNFGNTFRSALYLAFEYNGYFWQGRFGTVVFDLELLRRKPDVAAWKDMDALMAWVRGFTRRWNATPGDVTWDEPVESSLNGVPAIRVEGKTENNAKVVRRYYFPFEEDYALEVSVNLVDNSDRPGLAKSNWRPRAEAFREKLLSTVKVSVSPKSKAPSE